MHNVCPGQPVDQGLGFFNTLLEIIQSTGNDALIQVKRNQPTLFDTLSG